MSSNRSSSPASPEARRSPAASLQRGWPTLIVLPALVAIIGAGTISPLIAMFLGAHFGLSGGREAPWPWALAIIGLLAFWAAKLLDRSPVSRNATPIVLAVLAIPVVLIWWAIEPVWDVLPVLRDPISLVRGNGHLFIPLMLGLGAWVQGIRIAFAPELLAPELLRERVRNSLVALALIMILAGLVGGDIGAAGVSAEMIALPLVLVCSAGAVAAAELESTRRLATKRHTTAPGWDRWFRVFGGASLVLLVVIGLGMLLLGPGALDMLMAGLRGAWSVIATAILWVVYGVLYVVYYVYRFIAWIINSIFGDVISPMEMPTMEGQPPPEEQEPLAEPEPIGSEYVTLLRWIGLLIAVGIVLFIILRMTRRRGSESDDGPVEEERSSVFSAALVRKQLRDMFRRRPRAERPRRLDLDHDPESVRETMLYLQVLAARQEVGREPHETPHDFADRLVNEWPGLTGPLGTIRERYERARYGETEEDRRAAVTAWREIWSSRKDAVIPSPGD